MNFHSVVDDGEGQECNISEAAGGIEKGKRLDLNTLICSKFQVSFIYECEKQIYLLSLF